MTFNTSILHKVIKIMEGEYIAGTMLGYSETPWKNDANKFNRTVGVMTGQYTDQYGQSHSNTISVDVQFDDAERIKAIAEKTKGSSVMIPVVHVAKAGGKNGAWLSRFIPKGAEIKVLGK